MKRGTAIFVVLLLTVLAAAGWLAFRAPPAVPAYNGPVETIRIANVGEYSIFHLIAKEKGLFAQNGLDAQIDEYDSGATSIGALLAGQADVAIAADFVGVTRMFSEQDLRVLAEISDHDVFRLVARRDKGIAAPADLKGKKIGVTKKTAGEYYLGRFLTFNHLDFSDIETVDLPPAEMIAQLESGRLDAVLTFEPHAYDIQERMGSGVIAWSAQGSQRGLGLVYVTSPLLARHQDLVERYVRSLIQAEAYLKDHDAASRDILGRTLGYDPAYVDYIWPKFHFVVTLDQGMILSMEDEARWLIGHGLAPQAQVPNYLDFISFDALEKAMPEAVTITH